MRNFGFISLCEIFNTLRRIGLPIDKKLTERDRVFIHFSFDNYIHDILTLDESSGKYISERMVSFDDLHTL